MPLGRAVTAVDIEVGTALGTQTFAGVSAQRLEGNENKQFAPQMTGKVDILGPDGDLYHVFPPLFLGALSNDNAPDLNRCLEYTGIFLQAPRTFQDCGHTGGTPEEEIVTRPADIEVRRYERLKSPALQLDFQLGGVGGKLYMRLTLRYRSNVKLYHTSPRNAKSLDRVVSTGYYFARRYWSIAIAAFRPAPIARITVAAPVTISPPA